MNIFSITKLNPPSQSNIKTIIGLTLLAILLAAALIMASPFSNARAASSTPAIYFVPHQDDETISMGADIARHTDAGRTVYVVLVTNGNASAARNTIKSRYGISLTKEQFSQARDKEFLAALSRLGVPSSNVFFEGIDDGTLTFTQAGRIIDKYIARFPGASYKSISWLDAHSDHYTLGSALNNRCYYKELPDCRFLQSPRYQVGSGHPYNNPVPTPRAGISRETSKVRAAVSEYRHWNPAQGRYSIGYISVKSSLDFTYANHYSLYHRDNSEWSSTANRITAQNWINANW